MRSCIRHAAMSTTTYAAATAISTYSRTRMPRTTNGYRTTLTCTAGAKASAVWSPSPWSRPRAVSYAGDPPLVLAERGVEPLTRRRVARHVVRRMDVDLHPTLGQHFSDRRDGHPHDGDE